MASCEIQQVRLEWRILQPPNPLFSIADHFLTAFPLISFPAPGDENWLQAFFQGVELLWLLEGHPLCSTFQHESRTAAKRQYSFRSTVWTPSATE